MLPEVDAIIEHLVRGRTGADVALIMSNGGFGGIWDRLLARLRKG
jgi:UDP-N-acetylmuramate-alanine ligase